MDNFRFVIFRLPFHGRNEFLPLQGDPALRSAWLSPQDYRGGARVIIIPGSARTVDDLAYLRANGGERIIREHLAQGGVVIGVCGGYQMLGKWLYDPGRKQGSEQKVEALGLLPTSTWFGPSMLKSESTMELLVGSGSGKLVTGVEIRSGYSLGSPEPSGHHLLNRVVARKLLADKPEPTVMEGGVLWQPGSEQFDGHVTADRRIWGTYLHLIFHNEPFLQSLLKSLS